MSENHAMLYCGNTSICYTQTKEGLKNKVLNTSSGHIYHIKSTIIIIAGFESNAPDGLPSQWFPVNKGHVNIEENEDSQLLSFVTSLFSGS